MADNAHPDDSEVYRDDAMLYQMDPSKLDKIEGIDARNNAVQELRNRLSNTTRSHQSTRSTSIKD